MRDFAHGAIEADGAPTADKDPFENRHVPDDLCKPKDIELIVRYVEGGIMKMNGWFCAILEIGPLLECVEEHSMDLFDSNVRASLSKSKINDAIRQSTETARGQKRFVHKNNGLVITCANFTYASETQRLVTLQGAQVINGCQTLNTIYNCYKDKGDEGKEELRDNLRIFAKVISTDAIPGKDFIEEVIIASNNQNPMKSRNLKSNAREQRLLQYEFALDEPQKDLRYFYIRKDGELDSLIKDPKAHERKIRPELFFIMGTTRKKENRYRHIDNEDLVKTWWAWIGHATKVNTGGIDYFSGREYRLIFKKRPGEQYWEHMRSPDATADAKLLEDSIPTTRQYLVAVAFESYIKSHVKKMTTQKFKREKIDELKRTGRLGENASEAEENEALNNDDEFLLAKWANNMVPIFTEVASFILVNKYGPLVPDVAERIIDLPDVHYWLTCGMDAKKIEDEEMRDGLLERTYAYLRYSSDSHLLEEKDYIQAESRIKLALGKRWHIIAIKRKCLEVNESMRDCEGRDGLKAPGQTYLESLPDLY